MTFRILAPFGRTLLLGCVLSATLPVSLSVAGAERKLSPDVAMVLQQRLVLLQEAAMLAHASYRQGEQRLTVVLAANQQVLEAELELAATHADRLKIRQAMLKNAETLEATVEALFKSAEASRMDLLSAQANRLRMKADLVIEQNSAP